MMSKIFVLIGFVAVCNAASLHVVPAGETVFRAFSPPIVHSVVSPVASTVVGSVVPSVIRSALPSVVSSVVPVSVSAVELSDWEAYKEKFGKSYGSPMEDRFRRNLYLATKTRVATHNELFNNGYASEPMQIDIFADYTQDELFSLRSIIDEGQDEWNDFKLKYGKIYDNFEDRFRKTVYFTRKATIEDHNRLFEHGFSAYGQAIDSFTDCFDDEYPSGFIAEHLAPAAVNVPAIHSRALVPSTYKYLYASHPYAAVRSAFPGYYHGAYYY